MAGDAVTIRVVREVPDGWWHKALREFWEDLMLLVHTNSAVHAPIDTGHLRNSLQPGGGMTMVDPGNPAQWMRVASNVPYGAYLDEPEGRDPHYQRGPFAGKPTKGWLSDAPERLDAQINQLVDEFARVIDRAWDDA